MMNNITVMWLCCTGEHPVGLVKAFDETEKRWKYYVGVGNGHDEAEDVQMILDWGQRYSSLAGIAAFEEYVPGHGAP